MGADEQAQLSSIARSRSISAALAQRARIVLAIKASVPARLDVQLIVNNYSTHKHPSVKAWLAHPLHPDE